MAAISNCRIPCGSGNVLICRGRFRSAVGRGIIQNHGEELMKISVTICMLIFTVQNLNADMIADFDDLPLAPGSHWSGSYPIDDIGGSLQAGHFTSGSAVFENYSDGDWAIWGGFAYSNKTDVTTPGFMNQFSSFAGGAQTGGNFGVAYLDPYNSIVPTVVLEQAVKVSGLYVTNTTYTALDMLLGNPGFSKKFGGETENDPDWLLLTITGRDATGQATAAPVNFYLADYRFDDNSLDYVLDTWAYIDLSSLGVVSRLEFTMASSDSGSFGMNTPSYFALDTIVVPEPATLCLLAIGSFIISRRRHN